MDLECVGQNLTKALQSAKLPHLIRHVLDSCGRICLKFEDGVVGVVRYVSKTEGLNILS